MLQLRYFVYLLTLLLCTQTGRSQSCTGIGQTPSSAFPVCGTQVFKQASVPVCGATPIPGPGCSNDETHTNKNPYWYKFTCFQTGTLGFTIQPHILQEDYDWQLFDITGRNPNDVFTDGSLFVCMNWSGEFGNTGASAAGTSNAVCGGPGQPLFNKMPTLQQGHEYLLLISHFSDSQSGYDLSFSGGTAVITDPGVPHLKQSAYNCGPFSAGIKLSKKIHCNSISGDGSEFTFNGPGTPGVKLIGITGAGCSSGFDTDSLLLQFDKQLPVGTYSVISKNGTDHNTFLDACGNQLPVGESVSFRVFPTLPVPMGTLKTPPCGPDELQLTFEAGIRCQSISPDGKDFVLSGPDAAKIIGASGNCSSDGLTTTISLKLDKRILQAGNYTVTLVKGPDGNTIESECHVQTPAGGTQSFTMAPQPAVLLATITAPAVCSPTTVRIGVSTPVRCSSIAPDGSDFHINGPRPVNIVKASGICNSNQLADSIDLQLSAPIQTGGDYLITVRNGTDGNTLLSECWQSAAINQQAVFRTADTVNASFTYTVEQVCKVSTFHLQHSGKNQVDQWKWSFDDGETFDIQNPVKVYSTIGMKHLQLTVSNGVCSDTKSKDTLLRNEVTALFDVDPGPYCPLDLVVPQNKSLGTIVSWIWDYGNGARTTGATPVRMQYIPTQKEQQYLIRLIVKNDTNCQDTADHYITAVSSCYIDVPTAFSPNNDGQNDFLYPLNAYKAVELHFSVYNRNGNLLFETTDWRHKWDGTVNGKPADIGTYVWMLEYTEKESGKRIFRKGTTVLLR